jgi:hypothetical protein
MLLEQLPRINHRRDRCNLQISLITLRFRSRQHHVKNSDIGISQLVNPRYEHMTDFTAYCEHIVRLGSRSYPTQRSALRAHETLLTSHDAVVRHNLRLNRKAQYFTLIPALGWLYDAREFTEISKKSQRKL